MRKGKDPEPEPYSEGLTNGSGSGRPKNMRIRTPNTDVRFSSVFFVALLRLNIPDNSQITIILCREKRFLYGHGMDLNTDILPSANA
jgi:hypothetical protein